MKMWLAKKLLNNPYGKKQKETTDLKFNQLVIVFGKQMDGHMDMRQVENWIGFVEVMEWWNHQFTFGLLYQKRGFLE